MIVIPVPVIGLCAYCTIRDSIRSPSGHQSVDLESESERNEHSGVEMEEVNGHSISESDRSLLCLEMRESDSADSEIRDTESLQTARDTAAGDDAQVFSARM